MRSDSETPPALLLAHVLQYYVYDYYQAAMAAFQSICKVFILF